MGVSAHPPSSRATSIEGVRCSAPDLEDTPPQDGCCTVPWVGDGMTGPMGHEHINLKLSGRSCRFQAAEGSSARPGLGQWPQPARPERTSGCLRL